MRSIAKIVWLLRYWFSNHTAEKNWIRNPDMAEWKNVESEPFDPVRSPLHGAEAPPMNSPSCRTSI